eukprot:2658959-Alexandrium_andersonii.AAC.1
MALHARSSASLLLAAGGRVGTRSPPCRCVTPGRAHTRSTVAGCSSSWPCRQGRSNSHRGATPHPSGRCGCPGPRRSREGVAVHARAAETCSASAGPARPACRGPRSALISKA